MMMNLSAEQYLGGRSEAWDGLLATDNFMPSFLRGVGQAHHPA